NWGKAALILDKIAAARAKGCDIDCDAYPYTAGANPLKNLLPPWVQIGGNETMLKRLALPEIRARIAAEIADHGLNNWGRIPSWEAVQISISPRLPETAGQTVAALAKARGCNPIDQICDHLIADGGATRVLIASISEDDIRTIVRSPTALVGSDGNCVATYGIVSQGMPHPRFYGTFPRIIGRYVHHERLIPLEQAIYKMTGGPAKALKLRDRGLLKKGYRADIAIFDPDDFRDEATYANPHQYPSGAHDGDRQRHRRHRECDPHRRHAGDCAAPPRRWQRRLMVLAGHITGSLADVRFRGQSTSNLRPRLSGYDPLRTCTLQ